MKPIITMLSLLLCLSACIPGRGIGPGDGPGGTPKPAKPIITYAADTTASTYVINRSITALTPTNTGGTISTYSVKPALPIGIAINASTGVISGKPTALAASANYVVTASNSGGVGTTTLAIAIVPPITSVPNGSRFWIEIMDDATPEHADNSLIDYEAGSSPDYIPGEDAPVGQAGYIFMEPWVRYVSPIDGSTQYVTLGVNILPFVANKPNPLRVGIGGSGKATATYHIFIWKNLMPSTAQIWIRDALLKDSLEISNGVAAYHFTASKTDTSTIGDHRFSFVVR